MDFDSSSHSSSRDLSYYWGFISRETEVNILSQREDGAFLLRGCISKPNACTLAVRTGNRICRYRIADNEIFDLTQLTACYDFAGKPVALGKPVERPQSVPGSPARPTTLTIA